MIGPAWTAPLAVAAVLVLFAGLAAVSWPVAASSLRAAGRRGKGTVAVLVVLLAVTAAAFLRPGEDTFTGLDVSAYRLMAKSLAAGRPLQGIDGPLRDLPRHVRSLVLYRPEHHKTTRSQSFRIDSLDSGAYRPFYYPLLPLAAAGFDLLVPGEARDYLPGFTGLVFASALLLFAVARLGIPGAALTLFFVVGTPFPAWFFRSYYPEAIGSSLIAIALLSWLGGENDGPAAALGRSLALGLAVAFHPVLAALSFPLFIVMTLGEAGKGLKPLLSQSSLYVLGLVPLVLMTRYITAPYGSLGWGSLRHGMERSPAIRAALIAAAALLILAFALILLWRPFSRYVVRGGGRGGSDHRGQEVEAASRPGLALILYPLLWALPTILALAAGRENGVVRQGLGELLRGTGAFWLIPLGASAAYAFASPALTRVRVAGVIVMASLPLFLFLKGWDQGGLWSQRRLLPFIICLVALLMPSAAAALGALMKKSPRRVVAVTASLLLISCGLANLLRWPAAYYVREEHGADDWVDEQALRFGDAHVFFDYHPYSVPFAVMGGSKVFGLGRYAVDRLAGLAPFAYRRAVDGGFFWVTAYENPGLERGVNLVSQGVKTAFFPVVKAHAALPALAAERTVRIDVLRAEPIRPGGKVPVMDKTMDRGPLGLRPPWGRADIPIRAAGGQNLPARWSRQGSGIVGPVPSPGEQVRVTLEAASGRSAGAAPQRLRLEAPWGGEPLRFPVPRELKRFTGVLARPDGEGGKKVRTGIYRLYADEPFDPSQEGIRGFSADLGVLIHRVRIEPAGGEGQRDRP